MNPHTITSTHNPRVKEAVRLRTSRARHKQQRTLIDGAREIERAIDARVAVVDAFICDRLCQSETSRRVAARLLDGGMSVWQVTPEVFDKLAFGKRAEGVVAVVETPARPLARFAPTTELIAVLVSLEKPGNVGAILRSADAAGLGGVIVADATSDLFNPNCIRASLGTVFTQRIAQASSPETLAWLRQHGYRIFAARLDDAIPYTQADYRGKTAIALGSEAHGLNRAWHADDIVGVGLPMHGAADSLNVSVAAAVLFYEALRQRST